MGIAVLAAGLWALLGDLEILNVVWYVPAWYGYLLLIDAAIYRLQGHSFLSHRRREVGAMLLWSVPFWYLFEGYNLVLENWYYVSALRSQGGQFLLSVVAFTTVLPACFFHAELIKALGAWRGLDWRPVGRPGRGIGPRGVMGWSVAGLLCVTLPLLWPRYTFPLVWGATFWWPELVNRRVGAPSLLVDLERGRAERWMHLLAGGMWAGLAWELLNFWARSKWIYTVPGFEEWKVFEMPLLGFLGFPVLSIAAFSFYSFLCHYLRRGRSWEEGPAEPSPPARPRRLPHWRYAAALLLAAALCGAVFQGLSAHTVRSRRPLLSELAGLDEAAVRGLRSAGLPTPERLYAALEAEGAEALAARLDLPRRGLEEAHRHAALALHKGMGPAMARLLLAAGVEEVGDLAAADSAVLHRQLLDLGAGRKGPRPRLAEVKVWVRAAGFHGEPRR